MDSKQLLNMNDHMLLSIVNMKLRDKFSDFISFCDDLNIQPCLIEEKLNSIGYIYNRDINQFIRHSLS